MPIRLETLEDSEKLHIAVKGNATWAMAAAALKQKGGNPSWPLVVKKSDNTYAAVRYQTVLEGSDLPPDTLAEVLPGLTAVEAVDINSVGTDVAWGIVNQSKFKLIVITSQGKFVGVMAKGAHRGDTRLPTSKLDQLAGQNVDLSQLGDFLLDE